jgi:hypothetical protein
MRNSVDEPCPEPSELLPGGVRSAVWPEGCSDLPSRHRQGRPARIQWGSDKARCGRSRGEMSMNIRAGSWARRRPASRVPCAGCPAGENDRADRSAFALLIMLIHMELSAGAHWSSGREVGWAGWGSLRKETCSRGRHPHGRQFGCSPGRAGRDRFAVEVGREKRPRHIRS